MSVVDVREPARPERSLGTYELLTAADVDRRVAQATHAFAEWSVNAPARSAALHAWGDAVQRREEEFVDVLTREVGKPVRESRAEFKRTVAIIRYYAQATYDPIAEVMPTADTETELTVHRRPRGVVAAICPWNFPYAISTWKVAPALAYGNVVLLKPSSSALASSSLLVDTAADIFPPGALQLVPASPADAAALIDDPRVNAVTFTGSVTVGSEIVRRAAGRGAPVQAELGGQNPSIVLDDAELEPAAKIIARAAMEFAGQKCTATRRVIVAQSVADRFVPLLVDAVRALNVGEPESETVDVGPVISRGAREGVEQALDGVRSRGARVLTGGDRPARDGWFIEPAVLQLNDPSDTFMQEETFGPAAAVILAPNDNDALRIANATRFGLAGAVFGRDVERARRVAMRLEAGLQRINAPTTGVDFYAPFGGDKASGYGPREQGRAAREFYTSTRTMLVRRAA